MKIKKIYYTQNFERKAKKLPRILKSEIQNREKLFRDNPFNPILKTHKLKGKLKNFWSFSIAFKQRILFEFVNKNEILFFDIGGHEVYQS
jgi:mRNA-degrading endonuclease YafQ of YafQ-DinJ toxin-antitoxin module